MKIQPRFGASQWVCGKAVDRHDRQPFRYSIGSHSETYAWLKLHPQEAGLPEDARIFSPEEPLFGPLLRDVLGKKVLVVTGSDLQRSLEDQIDLANRSEPFIVPIRRKPSLRFNPQPGPPKRTTKTTWTP